MDSSQNTVLFSGYAKVPRTVLNFNLAQEIGCVIEVDMENNVIVNCGFSRLKPLTNDFLNRIIVGYDLDQGMEPLVKEILRRCQLISKNAIIKALEISYQKFIDYK